MLDHNKKRSAINLYVSLTVFGPILDFSTDVFTFCSFVVFSVRSPNFHLS